MKRKEPNLKLMRTIIILIISCLCGCRSKRQELNPTRPVQSAELLDTSMLASQGNTFYKENKYQLAIDCYDKLIANGYKKGEFYFKRGYCESMILKEEEALSDYKNELLLNYGKREVTLLNIAAVYEISFRNHDSALYYINACLKLDPKDIKALTLKKSIQNRVYLNAQLPGH